MKGNCMKVINAEFKRLCDMALDRLPGAIGVYVLWSSKSWVRPTYLGEGLILERFAAHAGKFPIPLEGTISILDNGTQKAIKTNAEIVEALLLYIAEEIDRFPSQNKNVGKHGQIEKVFTSHGVLRIRITGYDPLLGPRSSRMNKEKIITLQTNRFGEIELSHPWKLRPLA
jgi:hypothetical protein